MRRFSLGSGRRTPQNWSLRLAVLYLCTRSVETADAWKRIKSTESVSACTSPNGNCFKSKCCTRSTEYACFLAASRPRLSDALKPLKYAQCRLEPNTTACMDAGGWLCSGSWPGNATSKARVALLEWNTDRFKKSSHAPRAVPVASETHMNKGVSKTLSNKGIFRKAAATTSTAPDAAPLPASNSASGVIPASGGVRTVAKIIALLLLLVSLFGVFYPLIQKSSTPLP